MNVSNCPVDGAAVQSGDGDDTDATIDYAQQDSNIDYGSTHRMMNHLVNLLGRKLQTET